MGSKWGRRQVGQRRGSWGGKRRRSGRPSKEQRVSNKDIRGKAMGRHIRRGRGGERFKSGGRAKLRRSRRRKSGTDGGGEGSAGGERGTQQVWENEMKEQERCCRRARISRGVEKGGY